MQASLIALFFYSRDLANDVFNVCIVFTLLNYNGAFPIEWNYSLALYIFASV